MNQYSYFGALQAVYAYKQKHDLKGYSHKIKNGYMYVGTIDKASRQIISFFKFYGNNKLLLGILLSLQKWEWR